MISAILVMLVGAVLFRVRGGLLPGLKSSMLSAAIWAVILAVLIAALAGDPFLWMLAGTLMLGESSGWGSYMRMGLRGTPPDVPDNEHWRHVLRWIGLRDGSLNYDVAGMTLRGLEFSLPSAILLSGLGYDGAMLLSMAVFFPLAYLAAFHTPAGAWCQKTMPRLCDAPTAFAELYIGLTLALALCAAIGNGPTGTPWLLDLASRFI